MAHEGCVCDNSPTNCNCTGVAGYDGHEGCSQYYLTHNGYSTTDTTNNIGPNIIKETNMNTCNPYKASKTYNVTTNNWDKSGLIITAEDVNYLYQQWSSKVIGEVITSSSSDCNSTLNVSSGDIIKAKDIDTLRQDLYKAKNNCQLVDNTGQLTIKADGSVVYSGNSLTSFIYNSISPGKLIEANDNREIFKNIFISYVHCRCVSNSDNFCCYCDIVCQCNYSS